MSLYQNSVHKKYLATQDKEQVKAAYQKYKAHFHNRSMQAEIRSMKEEECQDGFLNDLFVNVLGYPLRPQEGSNLIREKKNQTDGKKADGAILNGEVVSRKFQAKVPTVRLWWMVGAFFVHGKR